MIKFILCLDPDPGQYDLFVTALQNKDQYSLKQVMNTEEALLCIRESAPHFFFIDISSQKINGMEIVERLGADIRMRNTKFILLDNHPDLRIAEKAKAAGAIYLRKPYLINTLSQMLKQILSSKT